MRPGFKLPRPGRFGIERLSLALLFWICPVVPAWSAAPEVAIDNVRPPLTSIRSFLESARAWGEERPVRLTGTVSASLEDRTFFMQDGDAGIYVFDKLAPALPVGTRVEVVGYPALGGVSPTLQRATTAVVGSGTQLPVWSTTLGEAMNPAADMRLIRLEGRLQPGMPRGPNTWIIGTGGTNGFLAYLGSAEDRRALADIKTGSLLELTGVCSLRGLVDGRPTQLTLFVPSAESVRVIAGPPWWTGDRLVAATVLAGGGLLLALLWGWTLRRQVRRKTAELQGRLAEESALERRYRQLFEVNPHPMWVYDLKTLEFLAVNEAAIRHYGFSREAFLGMTLKELRPPEDLPALLKNVAAVTSGLDAAGIWRHRKRNGEIIEVEITSHTLEFDGRAAELVHAHDVTVRRRAEAALRASEERLAFALQGTSDGLWDWNMVTGEDFLSPRWKELLGYGPGELPDREETFFGQLHPDDVAPVKAALQRHLEAGAPYALDLRLRHRDGHYRWFHTRGTARRDAAGKPVRMAGVITDITERRQAQEALRQNEQYLRTVIETEPECVKIISPDGTLLDMNAAGIRMLEGSGLDEIKAYPLTSYIAPRYHEAFAQLHARVLAGAQEALEFEIVGLKGTPRWLETRAAPLPGPDGSVAAVLGITRDVTARKRAEAELIRSQERFATIFQTSPDGILIVRADNERIVDLNPAFERLAQVSSAEAIGKTTVELGLWADPQQRAVNLRRLREGGSISNIEMQMRRRDGTEVTVLGSAEVVDFGGEQCLLSLLRDITERRQAEDALKLSQTSLAAAQQIASLGSWELDLADERNVDVNPLTWSDEVFRIFGYEPGQIAVTNENFFNAVHPDDRIRVREAVAEALAQRQPYRIEHRIIRPDGAVRVVEEYSEITCDPRTGKPLRLLGVVQDITARRDAEQERRNFELKLQQAQKLESLGVLAGGIAHDFNNLLTAVMGNISLALLDLNPVSPARPPLLDAEKATQRAADLARQMLAYSGKGRFLIQRVNLAEVVEEMTQMLAVSVSKKAVLRFNFAHLVPPVEVDVTQLRQIILNLVINASDAIGERSGVIAVSTGVMHCDKSYLTTTWLGDTVPDGLYSYIEVADSGCGIAKDQLAKIFDPFYTTKFTGRGLGLAAVLGIVRSHNGALKVYSEVGRGTTFKVLFPTAEDATPVDGTPETQHSDWRGEGLILLVDDEESIRAVAQRLLERIGFRVVTAADGREALEVVREKGDQLACILLDLTMPHMDGEETFREIRRIRTDIPVVLTSGYSEQDVVQRFSGKGLAGFVPKPFSLPNLQVALMKTVAVKAVPPPE